MKGIILAGGTGTRLYPSTKIISKQLLPIYDKPMIYYPLSILMLAGIVEILIITTDEDLRRYQKLLGDGSDLGMKFNYIVQKNPDGLAQAFILGKDFVKDEGACLILGDNFYYGQGIGDILQKAVLNTKKYNFATVFGSYVNEPEHYGVVDFDEFGNALSIEEKPKKPKSNFAVTGLYFYPNDVIKKAIKVRPSSRGELEITTINQMYLNENRLKVIRLGRGITWLDTGLHESLLEASTFVQTVEKRQGLKIACIEEIAYEKGLIDKKMLIRLAEPMKKNQYGKYLIKITEKNV